MSNTDKSIDIYERLAAALDALPHGFPRTKSGVEICLIMETIPGLYVFPFWVLVVGAVAMWGTVQSKLNA